MVKSPYFTRVPSTVYLNNMIKAAKLKSFPIDYIEYLENHKHKDSFEIDHHFSLLTYSSSRKFMRYLKPIYIFHDKIRDKICNLI